MCAATHIVDGLVRDTRVSKLKSNQGGQIAMGFCATALDNRAAVRSMLHLASDFFADLECVDANVGTNRGNELGRIV